MKLHLRRRPNTDLTRHVKIIRPYRFRCLGRKRHRRKLLTTAQWHIGAVLFYRDSARCRHRHHHRIRLIEWPNFHRKFAIADAHPGELKVVLHRRRIHHRELHIVATGDLAAVNHQRAFIGEGGRDVVAGAEIKRGRRGPGAGEDES